jgi:hypothetical protein
LLTEIAVAPLINSRCSYRTYLEFTTAFLVC